MSRSILFSGVSALSLLAFACGSQADTSYRGEPLATLSGTVNTASAGSATTALNAALVWGQAQFSSTTELLESVKWVGESAPVSGAFPASFTLNVYQPPPASTLIACPNSTAHIALGFVAAVPANFDLSDVSLDTPIAGSARKDLILYLDTDEPADWLCFPNIGFTFAPTKGFHLLRFLPNTVAPRAFGACYSAAVEAPGGLSTPITITLGATKLPNSDCSGSETVMADGGTATPPSQMLDASVPPSGDH